MKRNIWLDAILGLVVGDALGNPVQFYDRDVIKNRPQGPVTGMEAGGVYDMPAGTWTDDSSMALATLASIIDKKGVAPDDIMKRFVKWQMEGEYTPFGEAFDQGTACLTAIVRYIRNADIASCGCTGENENGNGSLMRIMPVCLYYCIKQETEGISDEDAIAGVHLVSGLTHNHIRSKICCGIYYFCVKAVVENSKNGGKNSLISLLQTGIDNALRFYSRNEENLAELALLSRLFYLEQFKDVPEKQIIAGKYVVDALETAIWCLISTDSFRECLLKAVNLGDDADTVGAIAGGLAGLYFGYDAIPCEWLAEIKRLEWIKELLNCDKIIHMQDAYNGDRK